MLHLLAYAAGCLNLFATAGAWADGPVEFNRDIRPILSENCFTCHGPDAKSRKKDLRLDQRQTAIESGAIVPGRPAESELVRRIDADRPGKLMPPPSSRKRLGEAQKDLLRRWIAGGAEYQPHWSFIRPARPEPPAVKDPTWARNPIDRFILARLEAEGLSPSPEADRATLLRRLSLDLVGLPPSPAEVEGFLADGSPAAHERQVERLLASPHHGERWGRHWLDAARYADSNGYEKDRARSMWHYRDWVVGALNRDLPYDQFLVEQLAGDQLPGAGQDQLIATGFLRNSMINEEGAIDPEQFRMDSLFDRMDCIGKTVLGLTIQCAQCHDHKYDPLT
ncbi:MAG: DUF1549 domain-containing protein, partial [Thermoanaerobaculia bacterium]